MAVKVKWKFVLHWITLVLIEFSYVVVLGFMEHSNCGYRPPKDTDILPQISLESYHSVRKRSIDSNLRIRLFYDDSMYKLPKEKFDLINETVLPQAVEYWERTLMVRSTTAPIRLNRRCSGNQIFYRRGDANPYCRNSCENVTMCGEAVVPERHLDVCRVCNSNGHNCRSLEETSSGDGIKSADFIFYVSAMQTDRCHRGMTVAYAAHCQQEAALDRPIAGHANLCPDSISTKTQELETLISTVKHEILHALGFSVSLYAFFRDEDGLPLTPRAENGKPVLNEKLQTRQWSDRIIQTITRKQWKVRGGVTSKTINVVVTPRVVEEVRNHFNCSKLEGAELEDQGSEGTALTHWEKRVFENEAMTGTHTQNPVYSRMTLALMEDSGWYRSNYEMAEELSWGRNMGCNFAMKSCKEWMDTRMSRGESIHPFCTKVKREGDPLETECTDDRTAVALCNLVEHPTDLPFSFQNFDQLQSVSTKEIGRYGGSVALADYCPYIQEFTWKSQNAVVRGSQCMFLENTPKADQNFALELYGTASKCFDHSKHMWEEKTCNKVRQWQHWGSGCYQFNCSGSHLQIRVLEKTYVCYYAGQELQIQLYANGWLHMGGIVCPKCSDVCPETQCLPDIKSTPRSLYVKDHLDCGGYSLNRPLSWPLFICLLIAVQFVYLRNKVQL